MILAIKGDQFHKINSPVKVVEVIRSDNHPLVRTWMVKDAIAKHHKLFGWKLIENKKEETSYE